MIDGLVTIWQGLDLNYKEERALSDAKRRMGERAKK